LAEFSNDPPGAVTGRLYQGIAINCGLPAYKSALDIKWFKEDGGPNFLRTDLQPHQFNSKNGKLYFSELTTSDAGVYHCVLALVALVGQVIFSGQGPSRTSLGMELIVIGETPSDYGPEIHNDFPAIFPTPALRGGTFTIECFAYGKMPLYYSWKRSNGTIPSKVTYSDHNRVLTIPDAQLEDAGDYTCMVNRGNSYTVEKSIQLIVEARPFFTFPLSDKHIDVNQEFVWFCEAQGLPAPVYSWYKDGLPIQHQPGNIEVHVNVLKIYKAQQTQHQGMYQCSASNTHGTTLTSAQLRILAFKPTFIRRPVNPSQMGTEGGNISIACQPEAAPSPNITWSKNGFPLAVSTEFKERIVQLTTGDLFIRDLQISDKGIYQCTASNDFGSESSSGLLTVVSQTVMTLVPSDVQSEVNSTVFLPCQASYDVREKELVYVWDFGGKNVLDLVDPSYKLEFQGSVPGLYILSVQVHHTGVYGCSAVTVDSFKRNTAYLQVVGPPGEPGGVKAEISGLNATIKWMPGETNFADVTKFHIEFNTNYNPSWRILINDIAFEAAISTVKNELCSYKVQGLKPGSSYKFRVVAYNRYGPGPASLPSTLYKVANAAPITAISGGITDEPWGPVGTLAVKWNALPEEDLTGDKIGYRIYYRKRVPFDSEQWNKGEVLGGVNQFFAVVGADNYYLQYDVKIAAFNEYGEGPNSSVQIVMSQADMPVVLPSLLSVCCLTITPQCLLSYNHSSVSVVLQSLLSVCCLTITPQCLLSYNHSSVSVVLQSLLSACCLTITPQCLLSYNHSSVPVVLQSLLSACCLTITPQCLLSYHHSSVPVVLPSLLSACCLTITPQCLLSYHHSSVPVVLPSLLSACCLTITPQCLLSYHHSSVPVVLPSLLSACCLTITPHCLLSYNHSSVPVVLPSLLSACCLTITPQCLLSYNHSSVSVVLQSLLSACCLTITPQCLLSYNHSSVPVVLQSLLSVCCLTITPQCLLSYNHSSVPVVLQSLLSACCLTITPRCLLSYNHSSVSVVLPSLLGVCCLTITPQCLLSYHHSSVPVVLQSLLSVCCLTITPQCLLSYHHSSVSVVLQSLLSVCCLTITPQCLLSYNHSSVSVVLQSLLSACWCGDEHYYEDS
ncbi:Contactin-2, partial [Biomphalaria glabrata]